MKEGLTGLDDGLTRGSKKKRNQGWPQGKGEMGLHRMGARMGPEPFQKGLEKVWLLRSFQNKCLVFSQK